MKHLMLLRHAKASADNGHMADFDRPLAPRGVKDAPRIGAALRQRSPLPDYVLSSTALRARQTMTAVIEAAGLTIEPQLEPMLYAAPAERLLAIVRRLPAVSACALLVGHNNGLEDLLGRLTGDWRHMPTAALASISLDIDRWDEADDDRGALHWFLTPGQLTDDTQ